jgi:hypothetical protein
MYLYMTELINPDNWPAVAEVIRPIVEGDILNDEIARENVRALAKLDDLGETKIRNLVEKRMINEPLYKKYLN